MTTIAPLPRKRVTAGAVIRDAAGRVLLVESVSKDDWLTPGGSVEAAESPSEGAAREVLEELGVPLPIGRPLVMQWQQDVDDPDGVLHFAYDGGVVDAVTVGRFRLPPEELRSYRFVVARDARLALDDHGQRAAPLLLLLHAGNATRTMWDPLVPALAQRYRVARFDARGFGDSAPAAGPYVGSDDVTAVLDALDVERAVLVGASFGGRLAIDTALAAPERVAALVTIGTVPSGAAAVLTEAEQRLADAADAAEAAADWPLRAELDVDIWSVGPTRRRDQVDPGFLASAVREAHRNVRLLETAPGAACRTGGDPAVDRLGEITVPVLSIVGEHDLAFTRAQHARTLAALGGPARGAVIPGTAHFPSVERPAAVLDVLLPWLADPTR